MSVEIDKNYVCLTQDKYMLIVYSDGSMCEGIIESNSIRVTLNPKEKNILSNMWRAYILKDY